MSGSPVRQNDFHESLMQQRLQQKSDLEAMRHEQLQVQMYRAKENIERMSKQQQFELRKRHNSIL